MPIPLILFLISLAGITVMIGRKLSLVRSDQMVKVMHPHPFVPELQKVKKITSKGAKRLGYIMLFVTLRFFIKSSNSIKVKSRLLIKELNDRLKKASSKSADGTGKKEVSKYLRTISDYRQKIRKMKHMIKKEEGIE